jgi:phosphohistidine phosphatase SixA
MSRLRFLLLSAVFLPVLVLNWSAQADWLDDLRLGGYVIVLRHRATTSDIAITDPMSNPDKKTPAERQLSEQGRAQAKSIGRALHELRIPVYLVMTSPLQRAVDTGTFLGFGNVRTAPDLAEAGSVVTSEENYRRADALRKLVGFHLAADNNLVIVTHKPNLMEAFGKDWFDVREGEASVFKPDDDGGYRLIVRVQASEWSALKASRDQPEPQTRGLGSQRQFFPNYD